MKVRQDIQNAFKLVQRADLQMDAVRDNDGFVQRQPARAFIKRLVLGGAVLASLRTRVLTAEDDSIQGVRFGDRVLYLDTDTPPMEGERSSPVIDATRFHVTDLRIVAKIPFRVARRNIERDRFRATVQGALAKAGRRDLEQVVMGGDVDSTVPLLSLFDGLLAHAGDVGHTIAVNAQMSKATLDRMHRRLPDVYDGDSEDASSADTPVIYMRRAEKLAYQSQLEGGIGDLADAMLAAVNRIPANDAAGKRMLRFRGMDIITTSSIPADFGVGGDETVSLMGAPSHFVMGIEQKMEIGVEQRVVDGQIVIVMRMSVDAQVDEGDGVVLATGVIPVAA
jgi:hypothetical protein